MKVFIEIMKLRDKFSAVIIMEENILANSRENKWARKKEMAPGLVLPVKSSVEVSEENCVWAFGVSAPAFYLQLTR